MDGGYQTENDVVPKPTPARLKQSAEAQRQRREARAQRAANKAIVAAQKKGAGRKV